MKASFEGPINEIPNICVDNFEEKNKMAYFLSHCHSDHTVGMMYKVESEELRKKGGKIYMSKESEIILLNNHWSCYNTRLNEIFEPLKVGMTYTIDIADGQSFEVTLIPVTHMIGAVMFLFKTKKHRVLFTGDFIIEENDVPNLEKLHDKQRKLNIDTMYVDGTFDQSDYEHFPRRSDCHAEVVSEIERWLINNNRVVLHQTYAFGYDEIYKAIKKRLNLNLYLDDEQKLRTYSALLGNENFVNDDSSSKIHICICERNNEGGGWTGVSNYTLNEKTLHIYISAQRGCNYSHGDPAISPETDSGDRLYLCYPTHCSRSQLKHFINYFSPAKTVKFPKIPMSTPGSWASTPYRRNRDRERSSTDANADGVKRRLF
ncbi:protein artemis-like [Ostrinia nubilalis]|uniref:protein artemis-like n=1 Tax=Ostrinia nubilalis TaxID=29057 RepID=UPI00308257EC